MLSTTPTPLVRLSNLFPHRRVYAKCEHLALSGCFKIRGAAHLLNHLSREGTIRKLIVPSMGNTAIGAAVGSRAFGFEVAAVVPESISKAKDEKLRALSVELIKIPTTGGSVLLHTAARLADERGAYSVHPHLDPLWTDGYQSILAEVLQELPDCRTLVFPVGGGGLLMGLTEHLLRHPARLRLIGCEAYNFPTYAHYDHTRSATIADGLVLDEPHAKIRARIEEMGITLSLVRDSEIRAALAELYAQQGMAVEPSSAITTAFIKSCAADLEEPVCAILTGENIGREDFLRLTGSEVRSGRA
jgi:threonine dehydratase